MEKRYDGKSLFKELDHVYEAAKSVQEKFIRFFTEASLSVWGKYDFRPESGPQVTGMPLDPNMADERPLHFLTLEFDAPEAPFAVRFSADQDVYFAVFARGDIILQDERIPPQALVSPWETARHVCRVLALKENAEALREACEGRSVSPAP